MKALSQIAAILVLTVFVQTSPAGILIFSEGMVVPETISLSPSSFTAYPNHYFVPDPGNPDRNRLHVIAPSGGPPVTTMSIGTPGEDQLLGGLFLPEGFGDHGGKYLVVGNNTLSYGKAWLVDGNLNVSDFTTIDTTPIQSRLSQPAIAPAGFGTYGGSLFVTEQFALVRMIDPTGAWSTFADLSTYTELGTIDSIFGIAFAPAGFGAFGSSMLVTAFVRETSESVILALDAAGGVSHFTSVPMAAGQRGLRQIAFAPSGFGDYGDHLFVSVSGSTQGGGALGALHVLSDEGNIVATLKTGTTLDKFDPRGLYFRDDDFLLISDASDPILIANVADFSPVPEPSSIILCTQFAVVAIVASRRMRKSG